MACQLPRPWPAMAMAVLLQTDLDTEIASESAPVNAEIPQENRGYRST